MKPEHADTISHPSFTLYRGHSPLLISLPHVGTELPDGLLPRLQPRARQLADTDWHLDRLYGFVRGMGVGMIVPRLSRIVIDLNRPPEDGPMYPGANNTGLCPTRLFSGEPIYSDGQAPQPAEVQARLTHFWQPYHDALRCELERLKQCHGHALLLDGHSIKSELPWLFEGRLWDLNLGTADGRSCSASLRAALAAVLAGQSRFSHVVDGRFKGGYITRHYGQPATGVQAVQLEMAWHCCIDESPPYPYRPDRAAEVQPVLRALVDALLAWRPPSPNAVTAAKRSSDGG